MIAPKLFVMKSAFAVLLSVGCAFLFSRPPIDARMPSGRAAKKSRVIILRKGDSTAPEVLLTFDDGPHPNSTYRILDILEKEHVPAVFFVVGVKVVQNPDAVKRMIAEGQEVGNHTQNHFRLDTITSKQVAWQLNKCESEFERITGRRMTLMRPPGMRLNPAAQTVISELGYTVVGWTLAAKDFIPPATGPGAVVPKGGAIATQPKEIAGRILSRVKKGSIILLHDAPWTADALPRIIEGIRARGLRFESASSFLRKLEPPAYCDTNPKLGLAR